MEIISNIRSLPLRLCVLVHCQQYLPERFFWHSWAWASDSLRLSAVNNLTNQRLLAQSVKSLAYDVLDNNEYYTNSLFKAALDRLTDQELLLTLANNTSSVCKRLKIAEHIPNPLIAQKIYQEIATAKNNAIDKRRAAVNYLHDKAMAKSLFAELEALAEEEREFMKNSKLCPNCRQRYLTKDLLCGEKSMVYDREDTLFDMERIDYYCPHCDKMVESRWNRA